MSRIRENKRFKIKTPIFFIVALNFLIVVLLALYIIYLRFIPYTIINYDGYAVSGKDIVNNLLDTTFDADKSIKALKVNDQDEIYQNLRAFYLGASKQNNINLDYPIYVNDSLAIYNLSSNVTLITDDFQEKEGYSGFTLTSGALYNSSSLQRADYFDYILMKNADNLYINAKEIKVKTSYNEYDISLNSIINFSNEFVTYYSLKGEDFIYSKIIDIDDNSKIIIEDYNFECTYKEFLVGLNILQVSKKQETQEDNSIKIEENKVKEEKVTNNENIKNETQNLIGEENIIDNQIEENKIEEVEENKEEVKSETEEKEEEQIEENEELEEEEENSQEDNKDDEENESRPNVPTEIKWIKPTVECEDFVANVYSASAKVTIKDPSRVISKAVTFTFYKDDKVASRISSISSGELKVIKLLPDTTYKIIGTYQYVDKEGNLIESRCLEQEITTKGIENVNPIELSLKNGQVYSKKIELNDIEIVSDINDEAINGVQNAQILINNVKYSLNSSTLRTLLKGEKTTYQSQENIESNKKCDYEIIFFDTAGNKMKMKGNKGKTVTSKQIPTVKVKISTQEVISVGVELNLNNEDDVELKNYKYILYASNGKVQEEGTLTSKDKKLKFNNLDPQNTYTIKIYADFDIEDGKGVRTNQEIGTSTFTTLELSRLGTIKLSLDYNEQDLTYNSIKLKASINTSKTDARLLQILQKMNFQVQDKKGNIVREFEVTNLNELKTEEGMDILLDNLDSNTTYYMVVNSFAMQGSTETKISTSYTLQSFTTRKIPTKININNLIVTTDLIDMDVYIDDIDNSCLENKVTLRLTDMFGKDHIPEIEDEDIKKYDEIPTNRWIRITYKELDKNTIFNFTCDVDNYNETNDNSKIQNNYQIAKMQFITSGLGGDIDLTGLMRQQDEGYKNLIDAKSEINWYSKCFDVVKGAYSKAEGDINVTFMPVSNYNYGKKYEEEGNNITLKLLSNQCYVYDLRDYIGKEITLSFLGKVSNTNAKVYIQKGKEIGNDIEPITGLDANNWKVYQKTFVVPSSGYIGFYLEDLKEVEEVEEKQIEKSIDYTFEVKNIQAELGNVATSYAPFSYKLYTNVKVNFIDSNKATYDADTKNCKYYIRITSEKGDVKEYEYIYNSTENITENYRYLMEESDNAEKYLIELLIKQNGREYILDSVDYEYIPEQCTEIKSILTVEDYKEIQPYGNYIVLNDLDLTDASTTSEFTFGNAKIHFYGSINFNGKTIKKDTYSLTRKKETTSYMFYKLEEKASIKNLVIDYYINNTTNRFTINIDGMDYNIAEEDGIYSLFLYNEAKIDNVIVNLKQATKKQRINVGLLGYKNSGTIENFIVNFENILYGSKNLAGLCLYSDGMIQNGYLYGNGIYAIDNMAISDSRNIAGVVFELNGDATMQNIYNLISITMDHYDSTYSYAANMVYNVGYPPEIDEQSGAQVSIQDSTAKVRDVYSVQPLLTYFNNYPYYSLMDMENKEVNIGPNILNTYSSTKVDGSRYFCDLIYEDNSYNTKSPATSLYEPAVQNILLNSNGSNQFIIDQFVSNGYFPHLKLNSCMPKQENIRIAITGTDVIDVLSGTVVENNDITNLELSDKAKTDIESFLNNNSNIDLTNENVKIAEFRIYNPAGVTISEINVNYLKTSIMSQVYSKKVSTVYVVLTDPTSYLDTYTVESIKGKMANGRESSAKYGENEDLGTRSIEVKFIKHISTAEEWNEINNEDINGVSGLIQNYRLIKDIDFASSDTSPYITGKFEGYLDGKYNGKVYTLKNIEGTESLINSLDGAILQNLNIENFAIESSSQRIGLIANCELTQNIKIDNIHINNMEITSTYSGGSPIIGGICSRINSSSTAETDNIIVQNCGITNLNIEFTNASVTEAMVGGIIGYIYTFGGVDSYITNNYVQNLFIDANVTSNTGIGGIVGYKSHDTDQSIKAGTPYFYIKNCYTTGKIIAKTRIGGILGYAHYANCYVQNCYSLVNINSNLTSGSVYIGGITGANEGGANCIVNNLYLGNIYVSGNNLPNEFRIYGSNANTTTTNNYAYKDQLFNGEKSNSQLGATKLLTYDEIFLANTYKNLLKFDENYAYEIINQNKEKIDLLSNEYLPQLNDTYGNLQPYQKLILLDNDLKLDSITSTPSADKTEVTVVMKFENPKDLNLVGVKIENDDMTVKEGSWNVAKDQNGLTVVTFVATPNRAYGSYKIESIFYERGGQTTEKEIATKIKVELFKAISNAREWNEFFEENGRKYPGQNIKITGNIDFSTVNKIESKVVVGSMEADSTKTISNVDLTLGASSGFINEIKTSLKNINFQNCSITGKGSYIGVIGILRGAASNCNFNNITVNCTGNYDYIGTISRCISGSFNNITISKITCKGRHFIGGLCGHTTALGASSNIKGTYIEVTASGNYAGGLFGLTQGNITNIAAYQYSETGKLEGDQETAWLVKGLSVVGGALGQYSGGGNTVKSVTVTNSIIQGTANVGGNIGYNSGYNNTLTSIKNIIKNTGDNTGGNIGQHAGWTSSNAISTDNEIIGKANVGGNLGKTGNTGVNKQYSTNNKVTGTNQVGGNIGYTTYYGNVPNELRVQGANTQISGTNYVGGSIGRSVTRIRNLKVQDVAIQGSGEQVGGIVGRQEFNSVSISATQNDNYSISGAYVTNTTIKGTSSYVGGIAGYEVGTVYGAVVEKCTITSLANNVGGIAGYYTGYSGSTGSQLSSSNYYMWHSYCTDSTVEGNNYAGGLVGRFQYGNIQYCYITNTSVKTTNIGAGGLVGYFDNSKLTNLQYKATIKYNYIANIEEGKIISAKNSAGGLIGMTTVKLNYDDDIEKYYNVECNLIVTDVKATGNYVSAGIGSVNNSSYGRLQSKYMNNIYVYNCSEINGTQVGGITDEKNAYTLVSSSELKLNSTYTKNTKILDEEGSVTGYEGLNFGTGRYDYTSGYFPLLKQKYSSAESYWASSQLNVIQNKIAIPTRAENFNKNKTLMSMMSTKLSTVQSAQEESTVLPDIYIYPSGVNTLNLEFSQINSNTYFSLTGNDTIINRQLVKDRVYTINYDFNETLKLNIANANYWDEKEIKPDDVRNMLTIIDDEYMYLSENSIKTNKRTIEGDFVNIYKDKALDSLGNIFDITKNTIISESPVTNGLLEETIPIAKAKYGEIDIETYYHCSKITQADGTEIYKDQQMFIKDNNMYLVDGNFKNIGSSIIVDSYNNNKYEATLGTDGVIYNLLTKINYPDNFVNKDIVQMTNNIDGDTNVVLVYYSNGRVYGFNYITGKEVYDNNVETENPSLLEYIKTNLNVSTIYQMSDSDYKQAQELAQKLEKVSVDDAQKQIENSNKEETIEEEEVSKNEYIDNQNDIETQELENKSQLKDTTDEKNENVTQLKSTTDEKNEYITAYNPVSQSYVVYSTDELFSMKAPRIVSENDKINDSSDLISYYKNLSVGKQGVKSIGVLIIAVIISAICVILVVMYKKSNRMS